ncbi:hypothetical protein [Saccharothrix sp.]|uniref:hypothetical protein n=1 Tax=Saccharothrix sp. TaxID=1873460 RepID=UPI002811382F|nr:hypothetical protein [Saccharothrix sp.]
MIHTVRALVLGAALLMLAACTGGGDQSFDTAPPPSAAQEDVVDPAVPEEFRAAAEAYTKFRKVDPCGLLYDAAAVESVFGKASGDELLPDKDGLDNCVLRIDTGDFASNYNLYLEVGAEFDQARRNEAAQETLGGVEVFVDKATDDPERNCTVAADVDAQLAVADDARGLYAVELRVQASASRDTKPAKAACDVARQYLTATAGQWRELPRRDGDRSSPRLELGGLDPCRAVAPIAADTQGAQLRPTSASSCEVRLPSGTVKEKTRSQTVKVIFAMDEDPAAQATGSTSRTTSATIAGQKAAITERGINCQVQVPWQPATTVTPDNTKVDEPGLVQVVTIQVPDCGTAQATAEKVMAKVATPDSERAEDRADAPVRLGDLEKVPDAASVSAPFDPCAVGWKSFPEEVRHPGDAKPRLVAASSQDKFATACRYTNDETVEAKVDEKGQGSGALGKVFLTMVFWAKSGDISVDTVNRTNARDLDLRGKKGLIRSYTGNSGVPSCATIFALANGTAGVTVTQNRFATDPCAVAEQVSLAIAAGTP